MPFAYVLFIAGPEGAKKMISTRDQLADMLRDLKSRSRAKLILELGFFMAYFVVFIRWKLHNTLCYVVKPTDANNSKHVRGVTRYFRFTHRSSMRGSFIPSCIGDFQ